LSQAGIINVAGGGGGGAPIQSITTDDGTAIPVANNIQLFGRDTTEDDDDGIRTNNDPNGSQTIYVELTNRVQGTGTSTAGSNADLITFPLSANSVYRFNIDVTGKSIAGDFIGEGVGYTVFASARRIGGGAVIISSPFQDNDEDTNLTSSTISFIASGNDVILRAVGTATETMIYNAVGYYVVI
jgi:hypothetical protein